MPPTPPSHDDALDFDGLDLKPSGAKKSTAAESDFEKELEALFAEELASSDEKPASAPPVGAPEIEEDALLLDDLVEDAPVMSQAQAPAEAPSQKHSEADEADDEDILDLSAFGTGGELDLAPPDETAGGKDGIIDLTGLDELISGLGDSKEAAPAAPAAPEEPAPPADLPLDSTDMADLLENLDVPKAAAPEAPGDDLLELSLGDLVEDQPQAEPLDLEPAAPAAATASEDSILDLTLPDLSDPEPGRDLLAEQEQADMGGELNLSLDDLVADEPAAAAAPLAEEPAGTAPAAASMDQLLGDELGLGGLMEGIETSDGEPEPEISLDAKDLLAQIPDAETAAGAQSAPAFELGEPVAEPVAEVEPAFDFAAAPAADFVPAAASEPAVEPESAFGADLDEVPELLRPIDEDTVLEPAFETQPEPAPAEMPLADAALVGAVAVGAVAAGAAAASTLSDPALSAQAAPVGISNEELSTLQERLAQLATQVTGNSVAVVRLEGKLAEREKNLADIEARLEASQAEAQALREELSALRAHLEESLRTQDESVQQELAQSAQSAADKSQAAMDKALGAMDKALAALDKAQSASDKADALTPRVESAEMTVRGAGARLAQMENRQSQLDREVFAEITRAVPREAAKVIREEIAHLAASMREE
ncbi:hypothetical protein [Humidesulfovibrio idahonensis]